MVTDQKVDYWKQAIELIKKSSQQARSLEMFACTAVVVDGGGGNGGVLRQLGKFEKKKYEIFK